MPRRLVLVFWAGIFLSLTGTAFSAVPETDCGNATIPEIECACLVRLYKSANGPSWSDSPENNWNQNDDPGTWTGVLVSAGHVIGIHQSGNNLMGTIPDLRGLERLEALDLSGNTLSGNIAASNFPTGLRTISLAHNHLQGRIGDFDDFPELIYLNLSYNRIHGTIPESSLAGNLQYLFLDGNAIDGEIPLSIANAGFLNLGLAYNKLGTSDKWVMDFVQGIDRNWNNSQTVPPTHIIAEFTGDPGTVYVSWTPIRYTGDGGYYRVRRAVAPEAAYLPVGNVTQDKFAAGIEITGLSPGPAYFSVETHTPAHETSDGFQQNDLTSRLSAAVYVMIPDFPPVIVGQNSLVLPEDTPLTIRLTDLEVEDPDSSWPDDFELAILEGNGYTVTDDTIIPAPNFHGVLAVPVKVNDGFADSNVFPLNVAVSPVNDPPSVIGQKPLDVPEETVLEITLANLIVYDPDNTYPDDFTLFVTEGSNYAYSNNSIVPAKDFNGELAVRAYVSDGSDDSEPVTLLVHVTPVNDIPLIVAQKPLEMAEDTSIEIFLDDLTVIDPDSRYPEDFTLAVQAGPAYRHSGNVVFPKTDFNGKLNVSITVHDGLDESAAINLKVNVTPVNDAPYFTSEPIVNAMQTVVYTWDIETDDPDSGDTRDIRANTIPTWLVLTDHGDGTAKLAGKPTNLDVGGHPVELVVEDAESSGETRNFVITVSHVAAAPVITGQNPVSALEDTLFAITLDNLIVSEPDGTYPSGFALSVREGNKYTVTDGKILPDKNFSGNLTVPLTINDGTVNSNVFNLKVKIIPVNDPPDFVSAPVTSASVNMNYAYGITAADPDSNDLLFITAPILPGWLSFSDHGNGRAMLSGKPDNSGNYKISLRVHDASGAEKFQSFDIFVTEVGTIPLITGQKDLHTPEDTPLTVTADDLIVSDPYGVYPEGFAVNLKEGPDYTVDGNTIFPPKDFNGMLTVPATVGTEYTQSDIYNLDIRVTPVNDPPIFVSAAVDTAVRDMTYTYEITAHDPDGDSLLISGVTYPSWLNLTTHDDGTGFLTGMPGNADIGSHQVTLTVTDPTGETDTQAFVLTVTDANDAPVIVGQARLTTFENTPVSIYPTDLVVNDSDNHYPEGFVLTVMDGNGYVRKGNTVIPDPGFAGPLIVPVRVNDGKADSNVYQLVISVIVSNGENRPPVAPSAVAWSEGIVLSAGEVTLKSSPYSDPEGDGHTATVWMIRQAIGPNKCPDPSDIFDFVVKAEDGASGHLSETRRATTQKPVQLTEYTASNLVPGLSYLWRVGYRDTGSGMTSWSPFYSFTLGDIREGAAVRIEPGTFASEYAIVSFPGYGATDDVFKEPLGGLYDRTKTRIFAYDAVDGYLEYGAPDSPETWGKPGKAYWVLAKDGISVPTSGIAISTERPFEVGLAYNPKTGNGWNLVGCPVDSNLDWDDVEVVAYDGDCGIVVGPVSMAEIGNSSDLIDPRLWRWENGRYHADTTVMAHSKGYWVRAKKAHVSLRFVAKKFVAEKFGARTRTTRRRILESSETAGPPPAPGSGFDVKIDSEGGGCFFSSTW